MIKFFVNTNGIEHYSPRQLLKESKVDFGKHCQILIFSYVQAPHEATAYNSQQPRTLDCLYMQPLYTMHGGHQLYHIPTGKLITRYGKLHVIPTPKHIVDKINALGKKQNGSILKIESKYFPTWSAAVDEAEAEDEHEHEADQDTDTYNSNDESDSDSDSNEEEDEEEDGDDNTLDTEDSTVQDENIETEAQQEADEMCDVAEQHPSDEPNPDLTAEVEEALEPEPKLQEEQLNVSHEDVHKLQLIHKTLNH